MDIPNIIDFKDLDTLSDDQLLKILKQMDAKSLINICLMSKRARSLCKYAWKSLFKRDVTEKKICTSPNWRELYKIAMTKTFPVYGINWSYNVEDFSRDNFSRYAIGSSNLHKQIENVLETDFGYDSEEDIDDFFESNDISSEGLLYMRDPTDEKEINYIQNVKIGNVSTRNIIKHSVEDFDYKTFYIIYIATGKDTDDTPKEGERPSDSWKGYIIFDNDNLRSEINRILQDEYEATEEDIDELMEEDDGSLYGYINNEFIVVMVEREGRIAKNQFNRLRKIICHVASEK